MAQKLHTAKTQQPAAAAVGRAEVVLDDDSAYAPKLVPMKDVDDVDMVSNFCQMQHDDATTHVMRTHHMQTVLLYAKWQSLDALQ